MFANTLSTSRVVECTMLRQHGLTEAAGGSEYDLLELCWSHFFGSSDPSKFKLCCRNSQNRATKYADGRGSNTLDGDIKNTMMSSVDAAVF